MYRSFCAGEFSVLVERFGGIDAISLIDVEEVNGTILPDQNPTPVLTRNASTSMGRPLFAPAIRFIGRKSNGGTAYFHPANPETTPYSVNGQSEEGSYELFVHDRCLAVRCGNDFSDFLEIYIGKNHLFNGEFDYYKNQRMAKVEPQHLTRIGESFDLNAPLPNGRAKCEWAAKPEFDGRHLLFHAVVHYPYGDRKLWLAVTADGEAPVFDEFTDQFRLRFAFSDKLRSITSVTAIGFDREDAITRAERMLSDFDQLLTEKKSADNNLLKQTPQVCIEGLPAAGDFMNDTGYWLNSMLVGGGVGVRASSFYFGYFPLWDAIWPIREFLWRGQFKEAEKMLAYLLDYPHFEAMPWASLHLILQLYEYFAWCKNPEFLIEYMPRLRRFINVGLRLSDPESGLLASLDNAANDDPGEAGVNGFYCASCINSLWYDALRVMINFAADCGDTATFRLASETVQKIEKSYLPTFFVPEVGYLRLAVDEKLQHYPQDIFQNTSTIGLDYIHGRYLMRSVWKQLAAYQAGELHHPMGHCAVAPDAPVSCEMWRSVHMNQHMAHESKLARLAGYAGETVRMSARYLEVYETYGVAVETFNLCGCKGDESQKANFQAFSSAGACEALRAGVAGIELHRGGWFYTPAADNRDITIRNIQYGNKTFDVMISGSGEFAEIYADGAALSGTLQIPGELREFKLWEIKRSEIPPRIQLRCAIDLEIRNFRTDDTYLSFTAGNSGIFPILIASMRPLSAKVNGKAVAVEIAEDCLYWADLALQSGDLVEFFGLS